MYMLKVLTTWTKHVFCDISGHNMFSCIAVLQMMLRCACMGCGGVEGLRLADNNHSPVIIYMRLPTRSWCATL